MKQTECISDDGDCPQFSFLPEGGGSGGGGGDRRRQEVEEREDRQELRRQAPTLLQVQLGQGCRMRGTGEIVDGGEGFHSTGEGKGTRDPYPLSIGM